MDEAAGVPCQFFSIMLSCFTHIWISVSFVLPSRWKWWYVCARCLSRTQLSPAPSSKWIPGRNRSPSWTPQPIRRQALPPRSGQQPIRSLRRCSPLMLRSLPMHHKYETILWLCPKSLTTHWITDYIDSLPVVNVLVILDKTQAFRKQRTCDFNTKMTLQDKNCI